MTDHNAQRAGDAEETESEVPEQVAIEGDLPLTAIDIESQKDMKSGRYHPLRSLDKWFAARPTPAARLAVLGSILPDDITDDQLLKLMQIGPKEKTEDIGEYIIEKFSKKSNRKSSNTGLDEYYAYPNPNTQSPTHSEIESLRDTLEDEWGEVPTVLDPTSGRGIIPFEALRYNIPVVANELNPVPALITKVAIEYAPTVDSIAPEINAYSDGIRKDLQREIGEYYPTDRKGRQVMNYIMTYEIKCDSCGGQMPLTTKWWVNKTGNGGDAIQPDYEDGKVEYSYSKVDTEDEFDPSEAPVSRGGDIECPHCTVLMDSDTAREKFVEKEFKYRVYGVNYKEPDGSWSWRGGNESDQKALSEAKERVESDFELLDFFSEPIEGGRNQDQIKGYGLNQWRDAFTPRQLVAHHELFNIFDEYKDKIRENHEKQEAELIISILAIAIERTVQHNNRLAQWKHDRGTGSYIFSDNNFSVKRIFVSNNISAPRRGLDRRFNRAINSYEKASSYVSQTSAKAEVYQHDAADLSEVIKESSIHSAVVDPPYFDTIMYGELSDFPYMTKKRLLDDIHSDLFDSKLVRKSEQAVANAGRQEQPEIFYENKMNSIFSELRDLLIEDGVLTLMFTDREVRAWNTISKALIESGFTITASHPIKTEVSDRIKAQDAAAVNSSILLVARNHSDDSAESVLWEDIKDDIERTAREEALRLLAIDDIDKIDTSIAAFGPALERYSEAYPVENKYGDKIEPKRVLAKARQEVTNVIANDELSTETDAVDGLTRWYILCYTIYGEAVIPFDEANQLGMGADIDISGIYESTRIWSKSGGDVTLNDHTSRVQDIVKLRDDRAKDPSSYWNPVNPTETTFTYAIDAVHAALHVYEREGAQFARDWLAERGFKNDAAFTTTVRALLEAVPSDADMHETLLDLVSGEPGDYLEVGVSGLDMADGGQTQTGLEEFE
jgi:adenine-specific DNA methylase